MMEKQSGFLRLLIYLHDHGEKQITEILDDTDIPVHQLYASIEKGKELRLINSRIDREKYPARNIILLTEKGKRAARKLREFLIVVEQRI